MKTTLAISALLAFVISLFIGMGNVIANDAKCTNATLRGLYAFEVSGFFGDEPPFSPAAAVRFVRFNGQGNFNGRGFSVLAANVAEGNIIGTYDVQRNCTVQLTFNLINLNGTQSTNSLFGVIVDKGKKIRTVTTASTDGPPTLLEFFERLDN